MIIDSVRLRNFKSHADTVIKFGPGINVILGQNGAGKTSILEAISFALFKDYTGNLDKLVRNGHREMTVEVAFTSHGRKYIVSRRRTKTTTDSRLFLLDSGEKEIRSGDSGVDEEINAILGIDKYLFSNAIYVRQGEIERLLTESPSKRKQIIGRLLGIESIEKVWEGMRPIVDNYRQRKSVVEGELIREVDISALKKSVEKELSEVRERMEKTRKSITVKEKELAQAEKMETGLLETEKRYTGLSAKRNDLEEMITNERSRLEGGRRQLSEISRSVKDVDVLKKRLVPEWREKIEKSIDDLVKRSSEIDLLQGSINGRITELRDMSLRLEGIGSSCPLCGSKLTDEHRRNMLSERKQKISGMQKELSGSSAEKAKLAADMDNLRKKRDEMSALERRYNEMKEASGRLGEISVNVRSAEKSLKEAETKMAAVGSEMKALESGRKAYAESREKVQALRSEVSALREAYGRQEGRLEELGNSLKKVVKDWEELAGKKKEQRKLSLMADILADIRSLFDKSGLQLELRKRAVPVIENHIREFFREFNFEYSDISLSDDYDISLFGPGGESTAEMMSGGERVAAALALRLGIARTLAGPGAESVMLDEPTIFLDEQRRQDLIEVLKKMSVIPQMIVVTHDTAMEDAADSVTSITKSRGVSSVSS